MEEFYTGKVVYHKAFGTGKVVHVEKERLVINFIAAGVKYFTEAEAETELSDPPTQQEKGAQAQDMDLDQLKETIRDILFEEGLVGITPLADKWNGGEMIMKPGKPGMQEKSVPIDVFFHKIVMIRNQLRVLEQNINASEKFTESEKVNLQQYITRCYGSLTTFNVLFSDKKDWFIGSKKE
ncbi:MAG: hypothetical protein HZB61_13300 [Nitrospirae bacterium]|nr:hypothetical protein [Nitrospirota bacterium]